MRDANAHPADDESDAGGRAPAALARRIAHRARGAGHALPTFLILGTMKGGTSTLFSYLQQHPQVMVAPHKEVHFFDLGFAKGPWWYRRNFPSKADARARCRATGQAVAIGEATPYYLFHPAAAERIAALLPHARLIVLLRDPSERAFSHYRHMVQRGRESLSFEAALAAEDERLAGADAILRQGGTVPNHRFYSYRSRGEYLNQLQRFFDRFAPSQLHLVKSEDLFAAPQASFDAVTDFLRLERAAVPDTSPRNRGIDLGANPCDRSLRAFYEPLNRQLYDRVGRDFGW